MMLKSKSNTAFKLINIYTQYKIKMMLVFANTDLSESVTQRYLYHQSDNESGEGLWKVEGVFRKWRSITK